METLPKFRLFIERDHDELDAMIRALYREDASSESMSSEKARLTLRELTQHPEKGRIVVFEMDGMVAGYAIVVSYWSNEYGGTILLLDEFYVKPTLRRRGIGSAFLDHLTSTADASVKCIDLEVTPANESAHAFYLRNGFGPAKNRHLRKKL